MNLDNYQEYNFDCLNYSFNNCLSYPFIKFNIFNYKNIKFDEWIANFKYKKFINYNFLDENLIKDSVAYNLEIKKRLNLDLILNCNLNNVIHKNILIYISEFFNRINNFAFIYSEEFDFVVYNKKCFDICNGYDENIYKDYYYDFCLRANYLGFSSYCVKDECMGYKFYKILPNIQNIKINNKIKEKIYVANI